MNVTRAFADGIRALGVVALGAWLTACGSSGVPPGVAPTPAATTTRRLLYLTQSAGYKHDVLPLSAQILINLGRASGAFETTATNDSSAVTRAGLAHYDAVAFYTSGELPMGSDERAALLEFVRSGKGFVGIHSATDTFYQWPEYGALIGAYFDGHPWHQNVTLRIEDTRHPATASLAPSIRLSDEIYQFRNWSRDDVHVLVSLDTASVDITLPDVHRTDRDFAVAWTRSFGQGRVFYTALGHEAGVWQSQEFQAHLAGGIRWAMGDR
jgi:type 1 glutamine amidotransferase